MKCHTLLVLAIACVCGTSAAAQLAVEDGTAFELESAEAAMAHVLATYGDLGAVPEFDRPCRILFQDRVTVDGVVVNGVLGRYVPETRTVHMLSFNSESFQETGLDGLPDLETKFRLVVAHEIAHYFNSQLAVSPNPVLDECIAGYVQYRWLDSETVERLLAVGIEYEIDTLITVSMLAYRGKPNDFLLAGYRYFAEHPVVLKRCVNGNPPPVRDPFMCENR